MMRPQGGLGHAVSIFARTHSIWREDSESHMLRGVIWIAKIAKLCYCAVVVVDRNTVNELQASRALR